MRPNIRAFLDVCFERIACPEPIVELGAKLVPGQEKLADFRSVFAGRRFIGCDMEPGPGVDRIENLHHLTFGDAEVGTFILSDTLEHVQYPWIAMEELRRCLNRDNGLLIATSVMSFPIHGFPNDYWRYTPEGFRSLARGFGFTATFFSGDPTHPHSVCLLAGFGETKARQVRAVVKPLQELHVHAPPQLDRLAAGLIRRLAKRLIADDPKPSKAPLDRGGLEMPFHGRAWVLMPGNWVEGWARGEGLDHAEIRVAGKTIHRTVPTLARGDIESALNLPAGEARGFREQVRLETDADLTGPAELWRVSRNGSEERVAVAPAGVVVSEIALNPGFILHAFDEAPTKADEPALGGRIKETAGARPNMEMANPARASRPRLSVIVNFYNMRREAARTLYSLSAAYQRDVRSEDYEVIAVENGSTQPLDPSEVTAFGANFRYKFHASNSPSPAAAINAAAREARGEYIAICIDGARILSPRILDYTLRAVDIFANPLVATLGWHLGPEMQTKTLLEGYNQEAEDRLLESVDWRRNGYALFTIASLAGASLRGWFFPPGESNYFAVSKTCYEGLGGLDERFESPGGGLVNIDFFQNACARDDLDLVMLLGEGTFHQFHGGIATNAGESPWARFHDEYMRIRGHPFNPIDRPVRYLGHLPPEARPFLESSVSWGGPEKRRRRLEKRLSALESAPLVKLAIRLQRLFGGK